MVDEIKPLVGCNHNLQCLEQIVDALIDAKFVSAEMRTHILRELRHLLKDGYEVTDET